MILRVSSDDRQLDNPIDDRSDDQDHSLDALSLQQWISADDCC